MKELLLKNPDFQRVQSWFPGDEWAWYDVDFYLYAYRNRHDKSDIWYPSDDEKEAFISFVNSRKKTVKNDIERKKRFDNSSSKRKPVELYSEMVDIGFTKNQLDSHIGILRKDFMERVKKFISNYQKRSDKELTIPQAITRMGGFRKIVHDICVRDYTIGKTTAEQRANWEFFLLRRMYGMPKTEEDIAAFNKKASYRAQQKDLIARYEDRFAALLARDMGERFGLMVNFSGNEWTFEPPKDIDDEEDSNRDGTNGEPNERYEDIRIKKIMDTLATDVKIFLSDIPAKSNRRDPILDDMGEKRTLDPRQIAYVVPELMRFCTPETMMNVLEQAADRYPFLYALVDKLNGVYDKNDKDYQAKFYSNFKRAAQTYGYIKIDKGTYKADKANTRAQGNAIARMATKNARGTVLDPEWSFYDGNGEIKITPLRLPIW